MILKKAANKLEFEETAKLRDRIKYLLKYLRDKLVGHS
ncbi:UvrB/UvrC motif-containing protein [Okeania sp. KiyG1]